ncbi:hypothetical protein H9P43_002647 [Blastocladiella emersonii ATCC 22665]|nr:hypothetical protein H9P43_002647 [Blastocladiella emersonii ATCC 22665]
MISNPNARRAHENMASIIASSWTASKWTTKAVIIFNWLVWALFVALPLAGVVVGAQQAPNVPDVEWKKGTCQTYMNLNIVMTIKGAIVLGLFPLFARSKLREDRGEEYKLTKWYKAWDNITSSCSTAEFVTVIFAIITLGRTDTCAGAPALRQMTLGWVISYGIVIALPLLGFLLAFLCMPLIIFFVLRAARAAEARAAEEAKFPTDLFDKLTVCKFVPGTADDTHPAPNAEGEIAIAPEDATCAICIDEYQPGDDLVYLPCKHAFHDACLREWLEISKLCPLCKADIATGITGEGPAEAAAEVGEANA